MSVSVGVGVDVGVGVFSADGYGYLYAYLDPNLRSAQWSCSGDGPPASVCVYIKGLVQRQIQECDFSYEWGNCAVRGYGGCWRRRGGEFEHPYSKNM